MPTRPWALRISVAGLVGRTRRRSVASTLSTGLTLPVVLLGLAATSGCRTDSSATRLPSFNPTRWFERDVASGEEAAVGEDLELQPVPDERPQAPPLPPQPARNSYAPAPAPLPEPVSHDEEEADAFYGVRPTAAEIDEPREPSWTSRFKSLFQRGGEETSGASRPARIRQSSSSVPVIERPPVPPGAQAARRAAAVRLGTPEFESFGGEPLTGGGVEPVSQVGSVRRESIARTEPLPTIVPARKKPLPAVSTIEPQTWPYAVAAEPATALASIPALAEPEPPAIEADAFPPLSVIPQTAEGPSGPALVR